MGMLSRYQKAGGFLQLLNLMETCGPAKQEKFLKILEEEDSRWAEKIREKMIDIPKIMSWEESVLAEIAARLNELTLAIALHGLDEEAWGKLSKTFSHSQKRRIEDLRDEKSPSKAEISTSFMQIITEVRELMTNGYIRVDKIDPTLVIEDDIEDKINSEFLDISKMNLGVPTIEPIPSAGKAPADGGNQAEVNALKQQLVLLAQENKKLKAELQNSLQKLNQIKKLAA